MGAYGVDTEQLDAAVGRMGALEAAIEARLADLDARTTRLQAEWDGAAADAEAAAHARWQTGAQQMREGLAAMKAAAATAHGNYTAAVAANQSMWR